MADFPKQRILRCILSLGSPLGQKNLFPQFPQEPSFVEFSISLGAIRRPRDVLASSCCAYDFGLLGMSNVLSPATSDATNATESVEFFQGNAAKAVPSNNPMAPRRYHFLL